MRAARALWDLPWEALCFWRESGNAEHDERMIKNINNSLMTRAI